MVRVGVKPSERRRRRRPGTGTPPPRLPRPLLRSSRTQRQVSPGAVGRLGAGRGTDGWTAAEEPPPPPSAFPLSSGVRGGRGKGPPPGLPLGRERARRLAAGLGRWLRAAGPGQPRLGGRGGLCCLRGVGSNSYCPSWQPGGGSRERSCRDPPGRGGEGTPHRPGPSPLGVRGSVPLGAGSRRKGFRLRSKVRAWLLPVLGDGAGRLPGSRWGWWRGVAAAWPGGGLRGVRHLVSVLLTFIVVVWDLFYSSSNVVSLEDR